MTFAAEGCLILWLGSAVSLLWPLIFHHFDYCNWMIYSPQSRLPEKARPSRQGEGKVFFSHTDGVWVFPGSFYKRVPSQLTIPFFWFVSPTCSM